MGRSLRFTVIAALASAAPFIAACGFTNSASKPPPKPPAPLPGYRSKTVTLEDDDGATATVRATGPVTEMRRGGHVWGVVPIHVTDTSRLGSELGPPHYNALGILTLGKRGECHGRPLIRGWCVVGPMYPEDHFGGPLGYGDSPADGGGSIDGYVVGEVPRGTNPADLAAFVDPSAPNDDPRPLVIPTGVVALTPGVGP
jgi:hypothetical protein